MTKLITVKLASQIMLFMFILTIAFQFFVLTGVIPYDIVWGGKLETRQDMIPMVSASIIMNTFFLFVVLIKSSKFQFKAPKIFITIILWLMVVLFAVNTLGNLVAESKIETIIFTPITFILAVLSLRLAIEKPIK